MPCSACGGSTSQRSQFNLTGKGNFKVAQKKVVNLTPTQARYLQMWRAQQHAAAAGRRRHFSMRF